MSSPWFLNNTRVKPTAEKPALLSMLCGAATVDSLVDTVPVLDELSPTTPLFGSSVSTFFFMFISVLFRVGVLARPFRPQKCEGVRPHERRVPGAQGPNDWTFQFQVRGQVVDLFAWLLWQPLLLALLVSWCRSFPLGNRRVCFFSLSFGRCPPMKNG